MKMTALALALLAGGAHAAVSYSGGTYSENFDGMSTTSAANTFVGPNGTHFSLAPFGLPDWTVARLAPGTGTQMSYFAEAGTGNGGAIYSYGMAGSGERALGSLASGSNVPAFGVEFVNNAPFTIDSFTVALTSEAWRSSTSTQNILTFAWGVSGGTITPTTFLTDTSMTADPLGNVVGPAPVTTNGALNPPTLGTVSVTVTGLSVAPGQSIFLRWTDFNDVGNDAGLAIDDFSFSATPAPGSVGLLGLAGLVVARRRR